MIDHVTVVVLLSGWLIVMTVAFAWAMRRYHQQRTATPLIINNLDDEARRLIAEAISKPGDIVLMAADGPITAEELQRRGIDAELNGRAIEVVTRMGWPRPGDPAGLRPCVPVPLHRLRLLRARLNDPNPASAVAELKNDIDLFIESNDRFVSFVTGLVDLPEAKP